MKIFKAIGLTILIFFLSLTSLPLFSNLGVQVSNDITVALIVFLIFTIIVCTMMILEELRSMRHN